MKTALIRPGILVALKTTVTGGVSYRRVDLDATEAQAVTTGAVSRWETTREIVDPAEHERAVKVRGQATVVIRAQCAKTTFGLLCPQEFEEKLNDAIAQARVMIDAHNDAATYTRVDMYVLKGRVASTDEEAARAIASEVRSLLEDMSAGIDKLDASAIREAATKARQMSSMLSDEQTERVNAAIETARSAARDIVKRVEKNGEVAATVLAELDRGAIEACRIAFMDLEAPAPLVTADALPAVNVQRFDFGDEQAAESTTHENAADVAVGG